MVVSALAELKVMIPNLMKERDGMISKRFTLISFELWILFESNLTSPMMYDAGKAL